MQNAFGPLNLKPDEFWQLTLAEYNALVDGHKWRQKEKMQLAALMAIWISEKIKPGTTPDELLGIKKKEEKTNPEETAMFFDTLEREFENAKKKVN